MGIILGILKFGMKLVILPVVIVLFFLNIAVGIVSGIGRLIAGIYNLFLFLCLISILVMHTPNLWPSLGFLFGFEVIVAGILIFGQTLVEVASEKAADFLAS